ncbi:ATP-grasp domain-containing protein [Patescibacteria group bacterium]|nr:ATP-grasp domain-containing protein [Patescibacteria group bacterium]
MRIAIVHQSVAPDARLDELDTLQQVQSVKASLLELGHEVFVFDCSIKTIKTVLDKIKKLKIDVVFNLVESFENRDSLQITVPLLLDAINIPHTGCGVNAYFFNSHKLYAKKMMRFAKIPTPDWFEKKSLEKPKGKYILKSVAEDGSYGLDQDSIVSAKTNKELLNKIEIKQKLHGGGWFAEKYIDGREFQISIIGCNQNPKILFPTELIFLHQGEKICDYKSKWEENSKEYKLNKGVPVDLKKDAALIKELKKISLECWDLFELNGYARVDFRVDSKNRPWVLEFNANPCLTLSCDCGLVISATYSGLDYNKLIENIVKSATYEK